MSRLRPDRDPSRQKSSHLLHDFMRTVATIVAFEGSDAKEKERNRIEREYRKCDEAISGLIETKSKELTDSAQIFTQVVTRLTLMKETSQNVRNWLQFSKKHLRGKEDDVKTLWIQSVELQEELKLLESISRIRKLPLKIRESKRIENYLQASHDIVQGIQVVDGKLREVEAIGHLRSELHDERRKLSDFMFRQLETFLYVRTTSKILKKVSPRRLDMTADDDEPDVPIGVVVKCLFEVEKLVDALKNTYHALGDKLHQIFLHTTETLHAIHYVELLQNKYRPELLELLMTLLVDQFIAIAEAHNSFLNEVNQIRSSAGIDPTSSKALMVYEMSDVWLGIEGIMQRILDHYLDQKSEQTKEAIDKRERYFAERMRSAWSRKRLKKIQGIDFKFDNSTSAQVLNDYAAEERRRRFADGGAALFSDQDEAQLKTICTPAMKNVTLAYPNVIRLSDKIKLSLGKEQSSVLAIHINRFVAESYLPSLESIVVEKMRGISRDDSMKMAPPGVLKALKEHKVKIFLNFYQAQRQIVDLFDLTYSMPMHAEKILAITEKCIDELVVGLKLTFHKIVAYFPGKEVSESIRWSEDDQFCLFYRALPGWYYQKKKDPVPVEGLASELETLLKMHDGMNAEIMGDSKVLRYIALCMENCEWLAHTLDLIVDTLPVAKIAEDSVKSSNNITGDPHIFNPLSRQFHDALKNSVAGLMDFAEKCFLIIHWEIRIRCLHYLGKTFNSPRLDFTSQDVSEETERRIGLLVGDLLNISRTIVNVIDERKFAFFFKTLGGLFRSIFIRSADQMSKINLKAVKAIKRHVFHLDEALTQITGLRAPEFDEIQQYFDMFSNASKPGDIVMHIVDHRRPFSQKEYESAIRLVHRSYQHEQRLISGSEIQSKDRSVVSWTMEEEIEQLKKVLASAGTFVKKA